MVLAAATAVSFVGCAQSGDDFAAGFAERAVIGIGDDITPPRPTPLEADYLAAWAIRDPRLPWDVAQTDYTVEALGWEGNSGDDEGARIELRVAMRVHAQSGGLPRGLDHADGLATRCWAHCPTTSSRGCRPRSKVQRTTRDIRRQRSVALLCYLESVRQPVERPL
jgi:hypothetical protein